MSRETRLTNRFGRCRASIENSALCHGLTAARNQSPEGQDFESGDTPRQKVSPADSLSMWFLDN